jgi:hypothetical protein
MSHSTHAHKCGRFIRGQTGNLRRRNREPLAFSEFAFDERHDAGDFGIVQRLKERAAHCFDAQLSIGEAQSSEDQRRQDDGRYRAA